MSHSIGVRVEPKAVHWLMVEGTRFQPKFVKKGKLSHPKTYTEAEYLSWYKVQIMQLASQHSLTAAAIRYAEPSSQIRYSSLPRFRIEGVLLATFDSLGFSVLTGHLKTFASALNTKTVKHFLETGDIYGLCVKDFSQYHQDAAIAAISILNK